jgi:hypothetical protein
VRNPHLCIRWPQERIDRAKLVAEFHGLSMSQLFFSLLQHAERKTWPQGRPAPTVKAPGGPEVAR